jgi:hypothetical protein
MKIQDLSESEAGAARTIKAISAITFVCRVCPGPVLFDGVG